MSVYKEIKLVIFDIDGTLYNQELLRKSIKKIMFRKILLNPILIWDFTILYFFRKNREVLSGQEGNIDNLQYSILMLPKQLVKKVVQYWMYDLPITEIEKVSYPSIYPLVDLLSSQNIKVAFYSDLPVKKKLKNLKLNKFKAICSTDEEIQAFKPSRKGFIYLANFFNVSPSNCLVVGDRHDRDGQGAINAGMGFYLTSTNTDLSKLADTFTAIIE